MALPVLLLASCAHAIRAEAADPATSGRLAEIALPGSLRGALSAIHDPLTPDRGQFLLEFIRRTYDAPVRPRNDARAPVVQALVQYLRDARLQPPPEHPDTLPLPLTPEIWSRVVFGGRAASDDLVASIVESRGVALFYAGLLSLDEQTRAWLAGEPKLIAEIVTRYAAAFEVAAPGLRVSGAAARVPGDAPAAAAWEALAGRRLADPAEFVRAVLGERQGRLAYFLGAMARLTPAQLSFALGLDSGSEPDRVSRARRLYAVFDRVAAGWDVEEHAFWRPPIDPALLAADLRADADGRPLLPGSEAFWQAAFANVPVAPSAAAAVAQGDPVGFPSLCERIFEGGPEQPRRYQQVLFASRVLTHVAPEAALEAVEAVRAAAAYPALAMSLERAGLRDPGAFAAAGRRAARLSSIGDRAREVRALAQFQGALAVVTRAVRRGSLPVSALAGLVSTLAAVDVNTRGDYEGGVVRWLQHVLASASAGQPPDDGDPPAYDDPYEVAPGPAERGLLHLLAGPEAREPRIVEWEGTSYRLDFAWAEANRLRRILGASCRPYISSAVALADLANRLQERQIDIGQFRHDVETLSHAWPAVPQRRAASDDFDDLMAALRRAAREDSTQSAERLAPRMLVAADDLLARGLAEFAYAAALGQPDRTPISAADAAGRHDFGLASYQAGPWHPPAPNSDLLHGWHVIGSLLGVDVGLADRSVVRLSLKPLPRAPMLKGPDRRALTEAIVLVEPLSLTDADRDAIVAAMRAGRTRLAAARRSDDIGAIADEIRLDPARRSVLVWMMEHDPGRVSAFLSPLELLWLGRADSAALAPWGAPGDARLGCQCLQVMDRRSWESLSGRWNSAMLASAFPDLNLRLAELLSELRMPAPLLAPVLASATPDLVDLVMSRDADDRRALVEYVQSLDAERVEEYLALLTTGGPLVPAGDAR